MKTLKGDLEISNVERLIMKGDDVARKVPSDRLKLDDPEGLFSPCSKMEFSPKLPVNTDESSTF